jgi:hypothetical protein
MEQRELDLIEASEIAAEFDREERRQRRRRKKGLTNAAAAAGAPPGRLPHVVEQTRENLDRGAIEDEWLNSEFVAKSGLTHSIRHRSRSP